MAGAARADGRRGAVEARVRDDALRAQPAPIAVLLDEDLAWDADVGRADQRSSLRPVAGSRRSIRRDPPWQGRGRSPSRWRRLGPRSESRTRRAVTRRLVLLGHEQCRGLGALVVNRDLPGPSVRRNGTGRGRERRRDRGRAREDWRGRAREGATAAATRRQGCTAPPRPSQHTHRRRYSRCHLPRGPCHRAGA